MPIFSKQDLENIPLLVRARIEIVSQWFYSQANGIDKGLLANVFDAIQKALTPMYDPDPESVHRCVGTVKYHIDDSIQRYNSSSQKPSFFKNDAFHDYLSKLKSLENLDTLYSSLKRMTTANPDFLKIERKQLAEEQTPLFKGFVFEYIAPEDRADQAAAAEQNPAPKAV